jgi:hypothetical protein
MLVQRIRQAWPNVRIIFRGDSGFCRWKLMRWCDKYDVGYIIGLARNAVLTRLAEQFTSISKRSLNRCSRSREYSAS